MGNFYFKSTILFCINKTFI